MNRAEKILKEFSVLCALNGAKGATINYSTETKKFYLSLPCDIKGDNALHGICEHRDTIEEAAIAAIEAVQGKILVFNVAGKGRAEIFLYRENNG